MELMDRALRHAGRGLVFDAFDRTKGPLCMECADMVDTWADGLLCFGRNHHTRYPQHQGDA